MTKKELNRIVRGLVARITAAQIEAGAENEVSVDEAQSDLGKALRKLRDQIVDMAVPVASRPANCELDTWLSLTPVDVAARADALVPPPKGKKADDE